MRNPLEECWWEPPPQSGSTMSCLPAGPALAAPRHLRMPTPAHAKDNLMSKEPDYKLVSREPGMEADQPIQLQAQGHDARPPRC